MKWFLESLGQTLLDKAVAIAVRRYMYDSVVPAGQIPRGWLLITSRTSLGFLERVLKLVRGGSGVQVGSGPRPPRPTDKNRSGFTSY